jgi:hypothetical protein
LIVSCHAHETSEKTSKGISTEFALPLSKLGYLGSRLNTDSNLTLRIRIDSACQRNWYQVASLKWFDDDFERGPLASRPSTKKAKAEQLNSDMFMSCHHLACASLQHVDMNST